MEIEALEAILMDDFKGMWCFYRPAFVMNFFYLLLTSLSNINI